MPKYFQNKVAGYYLYYTTHYVIECMHAHASDRRLTEAGSAKFFVRADGSTVVAERGRLSDLEIRKIQKYIRAHYMEMYEVWAEDSNNDFYQK